MDLLLSFSEFECFKEMMLFARAIGEFVEAHPSIKMLALSFLLLIGCALVAEGFHKEIPKGYIYFAMGFALAVEMVNYRADRKAERAAAAAAAAAAQRRD